jgi:hypothetical protein
VHDVGLPAQDCADIRPGRRVGCSPMDVARWPAMTAQRAAAGFRFGQKSPGQGWWRCQVQAQRSRGARRYPEDAGRDGWLQSRPGEGGHLVEDDRLTLGKVPPPRLVGCGLAFLLGVGRPESCERQRVSPSR